MSVPIFQKGELFKFEDIKMRIEAEPQETLEAYNNTYFEFLGVFPKDKKEITKPFTKALLDSLNEDIKSKCKYKELSISSGVITKEGEILRITVLKDNKMNYSDVLIHKDINLNKERKLAIVEAIIKEIEGLMEKKDENNGGIVS